MSGDGKGQLVIGLVWRWWREDEINVERERCSLEEKGGAGLA